MVEPKWDVLCPLVEQYFASSRRTLPFRFLSHNTCITLRQIRHHLTVLAASTYQPPYEIPKHDGVINYQSCMCISLYLLCKFVCPSGLQVLCVCMCDVHGPWEVWQVGCVDTLCVCVYMSACVGIYMCGCVLVCIFLYVRTMWWYNTVAHATHSDIHTHRKTRVALYTCLSLSSTLTHTETPPHPHTLASPPLPPWSHKSWQIVITHTASVCMGTQTRIPSTQRLWCTHSQ